ncbi:flagellinolysin [Massilia sp. G4R7]|uniref:Flagellin n=1 Tax=Massilia phyllostachyos TaxID=2898585 RepID=A0ABS8QAK2_9BURK|nr:flagellinolysin [Massilia phyllostachyos]MCD2517655.1 flagellinolysin [Massilia phyllostachyos]
MSLSITTNVLSMGAQRALKSHDRTQEKLIEQLSSGSRITAARDDPAGQAIAARISSGQRGMSQTLRSINDGTSMLQVAEGAMANVVERLQRLRELAVASGNATYVDGDRAALRTEALEILAHINQVGEQTKFNGETLFSQDGGSIGGDEKKRRVLDGLKTGWLSSAEQMVKQYYGIEGDGVKITVNLDTTDGGAGVLASVSGNVVGGKYTNLHLNLDMADFGGGDTRDGGGSPYYNDRVVAHEMAHAVMSRTMNFTALPQWFVEGTAELIQGADERVRSSIASGNSVAAIVGGVAGGGFVYEGGYLASRYLHDKLKGLGVEGGIKGVMQHLSENAGSTLDQALNAVSKGEIASTAAFLSDFGANGVNFVNTRVDLTNADTGAIGGLDADGAAPRDARQVVADAGDNNAKDGLAKFDVDYPELGGGTGIRRVQIQAGEGAGEFIELQFSAMNARALGLANLDMKNGAISLLHVDEALDFVNKQRVVVGASSNRLDVAATALQTESLNMTAAKERIEGVDYASSAAGLTRAQILQQAASAMLAQANQQPRAVLSLLR